MHSICTGDRHGIGHRRYTAALGVAPATASGGSGGASTERMPTVTLIPCSTSAPSPPPLQEQEGVVDPAGPCLPKLHNLLRDHSRAELGDLAATSRGVANADDSGTSITSTAVEVAAAEGLGSALSVVTAAVSAPWSETPRSTLAA